MVRPVYDTVGLSVRQPDRPQDPVGKGIQAVERVVEHQIDEAALRGLAEQLS